jgi:hypothetical protein
MVDPNQRPPPRTDSNRLSMGMMLGMSFGTAIGVINNNIALWLPVVFAVGLAIGSIPT